MSKKLDYSDFCKKNKLDKNSKKSMVEYKNYTDKLEFFNRVMSEKIANEAVKKASKNDH